MLSKPECWRTLRWEMQNSGLYQSHCQGPTTRIRTPSASNSSNSPHKNTNEDELDCQLPPVIERGERSHTPPDQKKQREGTKRTRFALFCFCEHARCGQSLSLSSPLEHPPEVTSRTGATSGCHRDHPSLSSDAISGFLPHLWKPVCLKGGNHRGHPI